MDPCSFTSNVLNGSKLVRAEAARSEDLIEYFAILDYWGFEFVGDLSVRFLSFDNED